MVEGLGSLGSFLPLLLIFAVMWFLLIRPQQVQQRKRQEMLTRIRRGDEVVTIGGIHGTITAVTDEVVHLRIADSVEVRMNKTGVGFIKDDAGEDQKAEGQRTADGR